MNTLWPVIVGGLIALLPQGFLFWHNRQAHQRLLERDEKAHKQQLERDQQAHAQQLERDRQEYERKQADAHKEQLRAGYAELLEAVLAIYHFMLSRNEYSKLTEGAPDPLLPGSEVKTLIAQFSVRLRDALNRFDKAWIAILLLEPGEQVISEELRRAMEIYAVGIETIPDVGAKRSEEAIKQVDQAMHTIFDQVQELRKVLPERLAQLGLPMQTNTTIASANPN
ncbi:MAG TPA: hypothetical protein VKT82_20155 [Ktedonobacterales bacterium]|nr:hypothetical protein [Ktedonobacterales bacterium]